MPHSTTETIHEKANKEVTEAHEYRDPLEYLKDELKLLDLRLLRLLIIRTNPDTPEPQNKGLYVTSEEIFSLLNGNTTAAKKNRQQSAGLDSIKNEIDQLNSKIIKKISLNSDLPMMKLCRIFNLNRFEIQTLLIAMAPEIDKKYERIYAYFNDDITNKSATVSLTLELLCSNFSEKLHFQRFFSSYSPLFYFDLISYRENQQVQNSISMSFRINDRIKDFLLGINSISNDLLDIVTLEYEDNIKETTHIEMDNDTYRKILNILQTGRETNILFWVHGSTEHERYNSVKNACKSLSLPLIKTDIELLVDSPDVRKILKKIYLESALYTAPVFLSGGDLLLSGHDKGRIIKKHLFNILSNLSWITFISADSKAPYDIGFINNRFFNIECSLPEYNRRLECWKHLLNYTKIPLSEIKELAGRFVFTETQINQIVKQALENKIPDELSLDDIYRAIHTISSPSLNFYARKIKHHYGWDDIVLPPDKKRQLKEICNYIKFKHLVYYHWGYERKLALGKGLNILFSGPSGTGKTMAADVIAGELGLELYRIDLSLIVSKYIGETEKNLQKVFNEASSGNLILFFDEADALFGKRTEVKDAHDRYANLETNYLLQKMEEHEGIIILATNLSKNMDEAFLRRMHFTVEFPFPDERHRELIWKKTFPERAPLSDDIDFKFLAERLKLSGGNIKNIALTAAFYAAEEGTDIEMRHIIFATKREFQKMGKLCMKGDFGDYYHLIEEDLRG